MVRQHLLFLPRDAGEVGAKRSEGAAANVSACGFPPPPFGHLPRNAGEESCTHKEWTR